MDHATLFLFCFLVSILQKALLPSNRQIKIRSFETSHDAFLGLEGFGELSVNQYDYSWIRYPVPFNVVFNNKSFHYSHFGECPPFFPSSIRCGEVVAQQSLLLITGCSSNHFDVTLRCVDSMLRCVPNVSVVFVDFGLTRRELLLLSRHLTRLLPSLHAQSRLYYRKFDFASFPTWMGLSSPTLGGYSWKVISYTDIALEYDGEVGWIDGGCQVVDDLHSELQWMRRYGIFSVYSSGRIGERVHNSSISFLMKSGFVGNVNRAAEMCSGGYLFLNAHDHERVRPILDVLVKCAYTKQCIDPTGSTRGNHRQDQSILTLLIHHSSIPISCDSHYRVSTLFHRDRAV